MMHTQQNTLGVGCCQKTHRHNTNVVTSCVLYKDVQFMVRWLAQPNPSVHAAIVERQRLQTGDPDTGPTPVGVLMNLIADELLDGWRHL